MIERDPKAEALRDETYRGRSGEVKIAGVQQY
jgi:hypothetical protein